MNDRQGASLTIRRFLRGEQGQDLVEYSLLIAFIAIAVIGVLTSISGTIQNIWINNLNATFTQFAIS